MIKKRVYKWHRWLSALAAIPLLMWSGSGLLHQAGAWVKPVFKKETYAAVSGKQEIESIIEHQYRKNSAILSIKKSKPLIIITPKRTKFFPFMKFRLHQPMKQSFTLI